MEHRAGIEPANTGFADQRVSHFATGALRPPQWPAADISDNSKNIFTAVARLYADTA
jgi:hypothetical protein